MALESETNLSDCYEAVSTHQRSGLNNLDIL